MQDHYKILGVEPEASFDEIRKAYRKLALAHHPDKNEGSAHATQRFREIAEAYSVLSNPAKRKRYHQRLFTSNYRPEPVIVTPVKAYEELLKLRELIYRSDPFRLNKEAIALDVQVILTHSIIAALKERETTEFRLSFVSVLLDCLRPLDLIQYNERLAVLRDIADNDAAVATLIAAEQRMKQRTSNWERYKTIIAIMLSLLLCLVIYLVVL